MPKVPKTTNLQDLCNILRKMWKISWFFADRLTWKVSSNCYYHFRYVLPGISKLPKITSLLYFRNILRKKLLMKLNFCMQINMKACFKLVLWLWWGLSSIPKVLKIANLQKKLRIKLIFCMQINIKVPYKLISMLWASKFPTRW